MDSVASSTDSKKSDTSSSIRSSSPWACEWGRERERESSCVTRVLFRWVSKWKSWVKVEKTLRLLMQSSWTFMRLFWFENHAWCSFPLLHDSGNQELGGMNINAAPLFYSLNTFMTSCAWEKSERCTPLNEEGKKEHQAKWFTLTTQGDRDEITEKGKWKKEEILRFDFSRIPITVMRRRRRNQENHSHPKNKRNTKSFS